MSSPSTPARPGLAPEVVPGEGDLKTLSLGPLRGSCPSFQPMGLRTLPGHCRWAGRTPPSPTAMTGDAWGCQAHLPPATYVCSPSGLWQGQSRACSHRLPRLWVSPGRCGHSHALCSCSSYPLGRDKSGVGDQGGRGERGREREHLGCKATGSEPSDGLLSVYQAVHTHTHTSTWVSLRRRASHWAWVQRSGAPLPTTAQDHGGGLLASGQGGPGQHDPLLCTPHPVDTACLSFLLTVCSGPGCCLAYWGVVSSFQNL